MINFPDRNGRWVTFFHIPKTGGSTVLYGIFSNGVKNLDDSKYFDSNRRLRFNAWHYNDNGHKYADHFPYLVAKELNHTVHDHSMAFIRNPWQRCVSAYIYSMSRKYFYPEPLTFIEWLDLIDHNKWNCWRPQNPNPQYKYLIDEQGQIAVSRVYKLEEVDIFSIFSDLLGKKLSRTRINVLPSYDYRSFYTDKLIEKVAKIYAKDIELFNYKYE